MKSNSTTLFIVALLAVIATAWIVTNDTQFYKTGIIYFILFAIVFLVLLGGNKIFKK